MSAFRFTSDTVDAAMEAYADVASKPGVPFPERNYPAARAALEAAKPEIERRLAEAMAYVLRFELGYDLTLATGVARAHLPDYLAKVQSELAEPLDTAAR